MILTIYQKNGLLVGGDMLDSGVHTHSNSEAIQERHRDVYRQFFASSGAVISAAIPLAWSPTSHAVGAGGIGVVFKLPLRIYAGFEESNEDGLALGNWQHYLPEEDRFQDVPLPDKRVKSLEEQLLEHWFAREGVALPRGTIRLLSEAPFYRGMGVGAAIAIAISSLVHLIAGKVDPQALVGLANLPSNELASNPVFDSIFRLAWRIESINDLWVSPGDVLFASFVRSRYPTVFFRESDPILFDRYQDYGINHPASYYNHAKSLFYRGYRFDELVPVEQVADWPFELALVFIGEGGSASQVYSYQKSALGELLDTLREVKQVLAPRVPAEFRETPRFLELAEEKLGDSPAIGVYKKYREIPVIHSIAIWRMLAEIFTSSPSRERLRALFRELESVQDILHLMGQMSFHKDRACTLLRECGYDLADVGVAVVPRMSGVIMVVGERLTLEPVLHRALDEIRKKTQKPVHCHVATWCDGWGEEGVRVEQHMSSGMFSPFFEGERVTLWEWDHEMGARRLVTTLEQAISTSEQFDVLFDGCAGKVLVRGESLTSQELKSAKQTVELMHCFFVSGKGVLESKELPESFYRGDRNQMESKLVRPIVQAVHKRVGKRLGLEIHGGLGSQYRVQFRPPRTMRVALIRQEEK